MIGIVNYGSGNIRAIETIYRRLNIEVSLVNQPDDLDNCDKIILPGVGAFDATMQQLNASGLREKLDEQALDLKKPILGICVGMQIMGDRSDEGKLPGLGWISGSVLKFDADTISVKPKLPHMGWNNITDYRHKLFSGIENDLGFYFVHSYYFACNHDENILSTTEYGIKFPSAIIKENIIGTQFHPEKSHSNGVTVFKNFALI